METPSEVLAFQVFVSLFFFLAVLGTVYLKLHTDLLEFLMCVKKD